MSSENSARSSRCSLAFETPQATISVQTAIATKTAMSFWDSVTTGAQNAAETTKLVSIVRPLFFCPLPFPRRRVPLWCSNSIPFGLLSFTSSSKDTTTTAKRKQKHWFSLLELTQYIDTLSETHHHFLVSSSIIIAQTENKTPSRSALLGATNQTNHAKLRRRVFPAHGAVQFRTRPTGVPQRAERHRRIPNENRREEQRNQRTESTNRKRRPIIIIIITRPTPAFPNAKREASVEDDRTKIEEKNREINASSKTSADSNTNNTHLLFS